MANFFDQFDVEEKKKKKDVNFFDQFDKPTTVTGGKSPEDFTKGEAMWYVAQKGLADTYRGGKQLLGIDEEEMAEEQKTINQLMEKHGGMVSGELPGLDLTDYDEEE